MGSETAGDASGGSDWSWRAEWTEPVRRHRLPVLLVAVAVLALLVWRLGARADLVAFAYLGCAGTLLGVVDLNLRRLPDPLTLPSYPVGLVLLGAAAPFTPDGGSRFVHALIGLATLWMLFAVQWFLVPRAFGLGDVKLSGVLGLYLGWLGYDAWMFGLVAIAVLGGLYGVVLLVLRRAGRGALIPYGPVMLIGALTGILTHP